MKRISRRRQRRIDMIAAWLRAAHLAGPRDGSPCEQCGAATVRIDVTGFHDVRRQFIDWCEFDESERRIEGEPMGRAS